MIKTINYKNKRGPAMIAFDAGVVVGVIIGMIMLIGFIVLSYEFPDGITIGLPVDSAYTIY